MPRLSIAAKLYIIFSLLAVATIALAGIAVINARHQADMTGAYQTSLSGHPERRAHERPDLCGRDGVARHLHVLRYPDRQALRRPAAQVQRPHRQGGRGVAQEGAPGRRRAVRGILQARRAIHRIPQGAGAARRRSEPREGPRVGRQRSQPQRPHRAQSGSRQARRDLRRAHQDDLCGARRAPALDHLAAERARALGAGARRGRRPCHLARRDASARRHHARDRAGRGRRCHGGGPACEAP